MHKSENIDYPAGHSADTDWFCIDKNGNIAIFDTGPEGCIPIEKNGQPIGYWDEYLMKVLRETEPFVYDLIINDKTVERLITLCNANDISDDFFQGVIILKDGFSFSDLNFKLDSYDMILRLSYRRNMFLVLATYDNEEKMKDGIKKGKIIIGYLFDTSELYRELGFYYYENECLPGSPYRRKNIPEIPANINDTNPPDKEALIIFRDILFSESEFVQPLEFIDCDTGYMRTDTLNNGNLVVLASDNKTKILCKMNKRDWLFDLNSELRWKYRFKSFYDIKIFCNSSYPQILVLGARPFDFIQCSSNEGGPFMVSEKDKVHKEIFCNIFDPLSLEFKDIIALHLIKTNDEYNQIKNNLELIPSVCKDSLSMLEKEIDIIEPCIIIGIGLLVKNTMVNKYGITSEFPAGVHTLKISGKLYPFIPVIDLKLEKNIEVDETFKSVGILSDFVKTILSKPRMKQDSPRTQKLLKSNPDYSQYYYKFREELDE